MRLQDFKYFSSLETQWQKKRSREIIEKPLFYYVQHTLAALPLQRTAKTLMARWHSSSLPTVIILDSFSTPPVKIWNEKQRKIIKMAM